MPAAVTFELSSSPCSRGEFIKGKSRRSKSTNSDLDQLIIQDSEKTAAQRGKDSSSMDGSINGSYHMEDENENSSQYEAATSSPDISTHGKSDQKNSSHHEMSHASNLSDNSISSVIRVDIDDIDNDGSLNLTTTHLRRCKRQVLRPYWRLLMFIGWRGFGREYINSGTWGWQLLNTFYPIFVTLMLFYTYIYEIIACQWKLNIQKDTKMLTTTPKPTMPQPNQTITTEVFPFFSVIPAESLYVNMSPAARLKEELLPAACEHIVTTYVVPNILHFVAFFLGIYHFRIQENEQMYALMEKVFLQANPLNTRSASQKKLTRNMRGFLIIGAVWILFNLGMQALYEWAFDFPNLAFFRSTGPMIHWLLFCMELFGLLVLNSVLVAVVTNYYTQCEMILFYVKGVTIRLQEKSTDLKTAMKDILTVRQNLSLLNGPIAKMTALVSVIFAELTILGISILALNENDIYKVWIYRSIYPLVWVSILAVPLVQAARVNSVCNRIKKIALEIRVFGYKGSSLLELDSFLNFVSHTRLRAKLFHIPILPSYLIAVVVLALFVMLILIQTGVIGTDHFF